jgi:hypothetical protein
VVAQEVNAATGTGLLLPTGLSGITCDVNSSADTSVPAETFTAGVFSDYTSNISGFGGGDGDGFDDADPTDGNPDDGKDSQEGSGDSGANRNLELPTPIPVPYIGDTATAPIICAGGIVKWYRAGPSGKVYLAQGSSYTMTADDAGYSVYAETECPDPSSPTQYGPPIPWNPLPTVAPAGGVSYNFFNYPNFAATIAWARSGTLTTTGCNPPFASSSETLTATGTNNVNGKSFFMVTRDIDGGLPAGNPAGWLAAKGFPGEGAECGTSGFYNRNGQLVINTGTQAAPVYTTVGLWGGNITMLSSSRYAGNHETRIVSIKLAANVPGLGVIGDEISGLGTYSALSYPPN